MSTPLERLVERGNAEQLSAAGVEGFVTGPGGRLLIFTGDPKQRPEAQDVAVVAQELKRERPGLKVGLLGPQDDGAFKERFKVDAVPTVVFIRDGRPMSTVVRVQDWGVYAGTAQVVFGKKENL